MTQTNILITIPGVTLADDPESQPEPQPQAEVDGERDDQEVIDELEQAEIDDERDEQEISDELEQAEVDDERDEQELVDELEQAGGSRDVSLGEKKTSKYGCILFFCCLSKFIKPNIL